MTRRDDPTETPFWVLVAFVLLLWGATGGVSLWLYAVPAFDQRQRTELVGVAHDVRTPLMNKQPVLDFALRDERVRFRVGETPFRELFQERVPRQLAGANVRVTIPKKEYEKPFSPEPFDVPTVTVYAMEIAGSKLLPLEYSRQWDAGNRLTATIIASVVGVLSLFFSWKLLARLGLV